MKLKFSFSKFLQNDKFLRIFSVFLGILSWFIVSIAIDPTKTTIINDIPVVFNLVNTTPQTYGLSVIEGDNQTVSVKIEGKGYVIGNLTADDFVATPVVSSVNKSGEYDIKVDVKKVDIGNPDYSIISQPSYLKASFDIVEEKQMDIFPAAEYVTAAEGLVKQPILLSRDKIDIKGPKTEIDKIHRVVAIYDKEIEIKETMVTDATIIFYDSRGNKLLLKNVEYDNSPVEITIPIYKHKKLPLLLQFVNIPQFLDISKIDYELSVSEIEVAGPPNILDTYTGLELPPIDFRTIDINTILNLNVKLATGLTNVDQINEVKVAIKNDNLASKDINIENIIIKNVPLSLDTTVKTNKLFNVRIVGDKSDIAKITSDDFIAEVDFANTELSIGDSKVSVSIYSTKTDKLVWAVGEYTILVNTKIK